MSPPGLPSYSKLGGGGASLYHASPPPDKLRSTTLFDMISHDQLDHQQQHQMMYPPPPVPAPPPPSMRHLPLPPLPAPPQQGLQERVSALLSAPIGSAPLVFNDPSSGDVRLTIVARDGFNVTVAVHRRVLVGSSRYLAAKLSLASPDRRSAPSCVEISDCDDVELYLLTVRLMYAADLKRSLLQEGVPRALGILKVAAAIGFEPATVACLEYLEAMPWPEDEEQRVASLVSQLRRDYPAASRGVLKRLVGADGDSKPTASADGGAGSHEELLLQLLQSVLTATNDRARGEMKSLVSRLLRENVAAGVADLSPSSLNAIARQCLDSLVAAAADTTGAGADVAPPPLSRLVDGLQWLAEVLIDRGMGAELVAAWASQAKLAELRRQLPPLQRRELSRVTARLVVALGRGLVMATAGDRSLLLRTWLEPLIDDFTWLQQRSCASSAALDKRSVEEGVCQTILTLPVDEQGSILMDWFRRFARDGDACPNLHRAFEVWWRRTFLTSRSLKKHSSHQ